MTERESKLARRALFVLLLITAVALVLYCGFFSGIGITMHDIFYAKHPDQLALWQPLLEDLFSALFPYFLIPVVILIVWIAASTAIILIITRKKPSNQTSEAKPWQNEKQ